MIENAAVIEPVEKISEKLETKNREVREEQCSSIRVFLQLLQTKYLKKAENIANVEAQKV